ncbi:MAG: hypothetical protein JWQ27_381 [Ferruginibacter sp.]|nr:hypothetical protein [Ferruginibacter sp.]
MLTEQTAIPDLVASETYLVRATTGKRFANYIIDLIVFYLLLFLFGIIIALAAPSVIDGIPDDPGFGLFDRLLAIFFYGVYMGIVEAVFKGKSIGKLITGTKAVNLDGSQISSRTAFGRGLSKAVPFCAFSALGTPCIPWQDKWTDTMVIDEKQSMIHSGTL